MLDKEKRSSADLDALLQLVLTPDNAQRAITYIASLNESDWNCLVAVADANHVVRRAFRLLAEPVGAVPRRADAVARILSREEERIENALTFLHHICGELERADCPTSVIKSLDHWPDLGADLDLYTSATPRRVIRVMLQRMRARVDARSWGDRLANKWNFIVPGLSELVEVHAQRLGQTGEHLAIAKRLGSRRMVKTINGLTFLVPYPEERIIIATLQRMYRHFYLRVCDIVNLLTLLDCKQVDFVELKKSSDLGGIWQGVATYLKIAADFSQSYRGIVPELPAEVLSAARFGGEVVHADGKFLRVPIIPNGASLYVRQVADTTLRGDVAATLRLSMLPGLASAAAVAFRMTGSDKGIW